MGIEIVIIPISESIIFSIIHLFQTCDNEYKNNCGLFVGSVGILLETGFVDSEKINVDGINY